MRPIVITLLALFTLAGCSTNKVAEALRETEGRIQAGNCTKATASSTVLGQNDAAAQTCTCTISREAGVKVTSATVSADENGRCEMTIAPIKEDSSSQAD